MSYQEKDAQSYIATYDILAEEGEQAQMTPLENAKQQLKIAKHYMPNWVSYWEKQVKLYYK